jgi:uncharacterized protein YegJ (DUF2314 family)
MITLDGSRGFSPWRSVCPYRFFAPLELVMLVACVVAGALSPAFAEDEPVSPPEVRVLAPADGDDGGTLLSEAEVITPPATVEEAIAGLERQEVSLVALLSGPTPLSMARARAAHAAVFGEVPPEQLAMRGVFGSAPVFLVREPSWFFAIHDYQAPYYDPASDPEFEDAFLASEALLEVLRAHDGYRAVDLVAPMAGQPREEAYRYLAPLLRESTKSERSRVVALYAPQFDVMTIDPDAIDRFFEAEDPVAALEASFGVSMVGIAVDDPEMEAAVAEARSRWPEFVASWRSAATTGDHFVKAAFGEAPEQEFLWIALLELDDDSMRGILMNAPHSVGGVAEGDEVVVEVNELNDWLIVGADGSQTGAFTVEVIRRRSGAASVVAH